MANISLSQSLCNISSSFNGLRDLSLTALSTLSASIGNVSYSGEFTTAISDFNHFNPSNTYYPDITQTTHSLNAFNGYDHYKDWIFQTGSAFIQSDGNVHLSPDVQLAEGTYGDSNRGHGVARQLSLVLSGSGEPVVIGAYRNSSNQGKVVGHVIKNFDSGAYATSGGGTGSIQRLTIAETALGVTNVGTITTHGIESGSALILQRDQSFGGRTKGQFIDSEGNLTAITNVHTAKTNNSTTYPGTNFSESAVAFCIIRGNMVTKPAVVRKQGSTLNPDVANEPTRPSGYSAFTCGQHGTLLAYRSGSDNGAVKKFFYVCFHSYGGNYKSNTLFYATPSQTEYNSDTGTWATIGNSNWTLINDDWKSQTAVRGSSNVGDFVGKHPETGDDWIVWFSLVGQGTPPDGQTYCHSARITQADSVTITDLSSQLGLNHYTGSRRYLNTVSSNAGGRCWQHMDIISRKDVTTEFVLHFNHQGTGSAQIAHYNFDLRTGDLSLISQLTGSTRCIQNGSPSQDGIRMSVGGMSAQYEPIPLGPYWNARDLHRAAPDKTTRHYLYSYNDMQVNISKSGWFRGHYLESH